MLIFMEPFRFSVSGTSVRRVTLILATAAILAVAGVASASAQDSANPDVQSLVDRLNRMQRDLDALQRQVYRGGPPPAAASSVPDSAGAGTGGPGAPPNLAADMQVRLDQMESEISTLTGQIQETNHAVAELQNKLKVLSSDIDLRFKALEAHGTPGAPGTAAAGTAAGNGSAGGPAVTPAPAPAGVLGTLSLNDLNKSGKPAPAAALSKAAGEGAEGAGQTAAVLPKGTPAEQYRYATSLLAKSDWAGAAQALKAFLAAHPKDKLAGNAQYWLGETYYARGDYDSAALAFAKGYKDYPKSDKGPANLLKLGMSLANLKKTESACASFARIGEDFPNASAAIKAHVRAERKKLHCH